MSGHPGNGNWQYQYQDDENNMPQLRSAGSHYTNFPPPAATNYYYGGGMQQPRGFLPQTPGPAAEFNGNSGLNPRQRPYVPPQRRQQADPIVRPESSISNASFSTQLAGPSYPPYQQSSAPAHARPGYGQGYQYDQAYTGGYNGSYGYGNGGGGGGGGGDNVDKTISGLGAGLGGLRVGDVALTPVDERSERSSARGQDPARIDSFADSNALDARHLAHEIMMGRTENPYDRSLSRYDTCDPLPNPTFGPARFKDSKALISPDSGSPDVSLTTTNTSKPSWVTTPKPLPHWLEAAMRGEYRPNIVEAYDALPMIELGREIGPSKAGVIRIKDIPYATTRQEMTAFAGRNAKILRQPEGSPYHAVHVMMERESGKTMDCFIEFGTAGEAAHVARSFARRVEQGRPPKVSDREVTVVYSSQDELMELLFPRAKHTRWSGGQPVIDKSVRKYYAHEDAAGFQGFMFTEEIVMLTKHAQLSERSPFASKSPCRVYEHMITTLYKYPWYAVQYISVKERRAIYDCVTSLLRILIEQLRRSNGRYNPLEPSVATLQELAVAALTCPGFSEKQKATIIQQLISHGYKEIAMGHGIGVRLGGHQEFSIFWPFASLGVIPGTDRNVLRYFAALFREASTTSSDTSGSLASRKTAQAGGIETPLGNIKISYPANADSLTMTQVAQIEFKVIEDLLKAVLQKRSSDGGSGSMVGSHAQTVRSLN